MMEKGSNPGKKTTAKGPSPKTSRGKKGVKKTPVKNKKKDVDIPLGSFFKKTGKTYISLIIWVLPTYLLGRLILHYWGVWTNNGKMIEIAGWRPFYFFQIITARSAYYISKIFGIPVEYGFYEPKYSPTLTYTYASLDAPYTMSVIPDCVAFQEIMFITAMIIGFNVNMTMKKRLKWAAVLSGVILLENQLRLVLNGPLLNWFGVETWNDIHIFWWKYGQLGVVIIIFIIWFILVGRRDSDMFKADEPSKDKKEKGEEGKKVKNEKTEPEKDNASEPKRTKDDKGDS